MQLSVEEYTPGLLLYQPQKNTVGYDPICFPKPTAQGSKTLETVVQVTPPSVERHKLLELGCAPL